MKSIYACNDAVSWVESRDFASFDEAWAECKRGDWMLWLAAHIGVNKKAIVRAACACAREALVYVPAGEDRPRLAIETAERWTRGEATTEEVREAEAAAHAAAYAAAYTAADAAAHAAHAAHASDADARGRMLARCADIVRVHITAGTARNAAKKGTT